MICKSLDSIKIAVRHFSVIFVISKQAKTPRSDVAALSHVEFSALKQTPDILL